MVLSKKNLGAVTDSCSKMLIETEYSKFATSLYSMSIYMNVQVANQIASLKILKPVARKVYNSYQTLKP